MSSAALRNVTPKLGKAELVDELLAAKESSGKTFTEIAAECGLTNLYTAQLFHNQAQLKAATAPKLQAAVPALSGELLAAMQRCPMRAYDPVLLQEPLIYRMQEAVVHYAESIKAIANEELGDGIMSAIDMFASVEVIDGKAGEKRLVVQLNGKWLPHIEQLAENNTAAK